MFRRLYWVKEIVEGDGTSKVVGVYTSIPDLIEHGMDHQATQSLRLSLVQLDRKDGCLGVWTPANFDSLTEDLQKYVQTDEMSQEHLNRLSASITSVAVQ
jgi:hypothetical protein